MRKVITYGTFDMFHEGHYNILKRAKENGDYLVVGVTGESYDIGRGKLSVKDSLSTRMENVRKTGFADEIIVEEYLGQKINDIIKYGIDAFVIGDDWRGKFDHLSEYCEMVYLPRTEGISSTQIREETFDKYRIGIIADRLDDNSLTSEACKVSGFAVTDVYAEDGKLASEFKDKFGLLESHTSLRDFLVDVDIVYVRTELKDRYRYVKAALDAGKHVISDVPCSISITEEETLLEISKEKNLILMHNLKTLHTQVFTQLLWMVKAGLIGDIVRMDCSASKLDKNIKQFFYELTTSALTTIMSILGTKYEAIDKKIIESDGQVEYMTMTIKYPSSDAVLNIGNRIKIDNQIVIVGTKGSIILGEKWWRADSFTMYPTDGEPKAFRMNYDGNGFKFIIKDMALMMRDGRREYRLMNRELDLATAKILQEI